jgi:hypothetical protein
VHKQGIANFAQVHQVHKQGIANIAQVYYVHKQGIADSAAFPLPPQLRGAGQSTQCKAISLSGKKEPQNNGACLVVGRLTQQYWLGSSNSSSLTKRTTTLNKQEKASTKRKHGLGSSNSSSLTKRTTTLNKQQRRGGINKENERNRPTLVLQASCATSASSFASSTGPHSATSKSNSQETNPAQT